MTESDFRSALTGHRFPGLDGSLAVVVGGAGGGVGTSCVELLVGSGAHVLAVDHHAERLVALAGRLHGSVTPVRADVTTDEGLEALDHAVAANPPAALVNVVGGVTPDGVSHFLDTTPQQWQDSLQQNLTYAMRTCQVVARRMALAGAAGSVVNMSIADAQRAMPWFSSYGAARSGLEGLTRTMAVELGPLGIRANTVAWGLINSPRAHAGTGLDGRRERELIPLGRRGLVDEVAGAVLFLLSELGRYVTGQCLVVDGGLSLRMGHYRPTDNLPEFLESSSARERLRTTFDAHVHRARG